MFREHGSVLAQASESTKLLPIYVQGLVEVTFALTVTLIITPTKTQLHLIFNLPNMHQPYKFNGAKDLIVVEEWLE